MSSRVRPRCPEQLAPGGRESIDPLEKPADDRLIEVAKEPLDEPDGPTLGTEAVCHQCRGPVVRRSIATSTRVQRGTAAPSR